MAIGRQVNKVVNYTWRFKDTDKTLLSMENIRRASGLAATAIAGAMAALAVSSVKVASAFVEIENQFYVVFGESAPRARAELDAFADSIGRSGNKMLAYAATIQDTLVPLGMARDRAAELSVEVVKLATDLSSFKNLDLDETIHRISYGLVGQHRSVQRLGIIINQTTLAQELMNMGIMGGVQAATESEKAHARLNLMYAASRDAMGDSIRTAGEFENQIRVLEDAWYDVRLEIGERLIPMLNELIPDIKEMIFDFGEFAVNVIPPTVKGFIELTKAVKALIPVALALAAAVAANAAITGGLSTAYTALQIKAISLTGSMLTLKSAIGMGGVAVAVGFAIERIVKLNQVIGETEDALDGARKAGEMEDEAMRVMAITNVEIARAIEEGSIPALEALQDELESMQYYLNPEANGLDEVNAALGDLERQATKAALGEMRVVRAMAEIKGATPDVLIAIDEQIDLLSKAAMLAGGYDPSASWAGRTASGTTGTGSGDREPDEGKGIQTLKEALEIDKMRAEIYDGMTQKQYESMLVMHDYKMETLTLEMEQSQRINDILLSGANQFGRALRNGGEDMLGLAIQIGLELARAKLGDAALGGFSGGIFSFLGGFL